MLTFLQQTVHHVLFMDPQIPLFSNFFIKNGSHSTIYTFKNYFSTVILAINFQFQQNKSYPNRPINSCGSKVNLQRTPPRPILYTCAPFIYLFIFLFLISCHLPPATPSSLTKKMYYIRQNQSTRTLAFTGFFF